MKNTTLLIMAAGIGSRFGTGSKERPVGADGRYQKSCVPASEQCEHRRAPESFE